MQKRLYIICSDVKSSLPLRKKSTVINIGKGEKRFKVALDNMKYKNKYEGIPI